MHDFKPQLDQVKKQTSRKFLLFSVIAVLATGFFYFTGDKLIPEPQLSGAVDVKMLPLPLQTSDDDQLADETQPNLSQQQDNLIADTTQPAISQAVISDSEESILLPETLESHSIGMVEQSEPAAMSAVWESRIIQSGDSLANIFKEWQLSAGTLHKIVNSSELGKTLADIHPGETLKLQRDDDAGLLALKLIRSPTESLLITRTEGGYESEKLIREVDVRQAFASGSINSSLFVDGQAAGLTDAQIMELAGIFGWDIDFALEIRKGDNFKILFEEHFLDDKKLRNGPILMAEFNNDGKTFKAVRYTKPDGDTGYYDPDDGRNKKRAFIRTPVKFARISSRFSLSRFHPKLNRWRAHRGVDYAAPTGTPVKAAGKGKVIFRGTKGGYGKTVILQHGTKYTTLYAHLSKYAGASRKGSTVKQGQIIGYVGMTGLATGPHLHYEFRVDGVHRNPLTVKLPKADPIDARYKQDFSKQVDLLLASFESFDQQGQQQLAQNPAIKGDG